MKANFIVADPEDLPWPSERKEGGFDSQSKRLGTVARVRAAGMQFWRKGERGLLRVDCADGADDVARVIRPGPISRGSPVVGVPSSLPQRA